MSTQGKGYRHYTPSSNTRSYHPLGNLSWRRTGNSTLSKAEKRQEDRRLAKYAAYRRYHRSKRQFWLLPFAIVFVLPFAGLLGLPAEVLLLGFIGTFALAIGKTRDVDA